MTAKQWLNRGYRINEEINELMREQKQALLQATSTALGGGEKVQSSNGNTVERRFVNYAAYSETIDMWIDELYSIKREIVLEIRKVDDFRLRRLLFLRYIKFYTWDMIAQKMNYDIRYIHKLHNCALKKIKKRALNDTLYL
ncbi:MAG: hypothetical protein ACLRQ0_10245 [Monoglobales bacterium]